MSFDGITVHALTRELNEALKGGRIVKIAQPLPENNLLVNVRFFGVFIIPPQLVLHLQFLL